MRGLSDIERMNLEAERRVLGKEYSNTDGTQMIISCCVEAYCPDCGNTCHEYNVMLEGEEEQEFTCRDCGRVFTGRLGASR